MPFCQGGMFIHWQAEVVDKGCQHMAKASFGIGTLWWMKLLLKMCHSKINKRLTGQRWMVLYSTNPWWTHTSWNFTHFGWYLKTGLSTSSNMLQKGNNWHKICFFLIQFHRKYACSSNMLRTEWWNFTASQGESPLPESDPEEGSMMMSNFTLIASTLKRWNSPYWPYRVPRIVLSFWNLSGGMIQAACI